MTYLLIIIVHLGGILQSVFIGPRYLTLHTVVFYFDYSDLDINLRVKSFLSILHPSKFNHPVSQPNENQI